MNARGNNGIARITAALAIGLVIFGVAPFAMAGAPRTFVKSTGNDSNTATNCPVTNPCQTFAMAYTVTGAGGEIVALDSSGYGPISITTSLSIIGIERAFIKAPSGGSGITINGSGIQVLLQNIEITGNGLSNTTGITLTSGSLVLLDSILTQLTTGLTVPSGSRTDIVNTAILFNATGITTNGQGTDPEGSFGGTEVRLYEDRVFGNTTGFNMVNPGVSISSSFSDVTILEMDGNNHLAGNTTLVNGSGTGCPSGAVSGKCDHILQATSSVNNAQGP